MMWEGCFAKNIIVKYVYDFSMGNRMIEEEKGIRKKRTEVEEVAEMVATCRSALRGMEDMHPRPSENIFKQNRQWLKEHEEKLNKLRKKHGEKTVTMALRRAIEDKNKSEVERRAMMQAMSRQNPGQRHFEWGGSTEFQELYDQMMFAPPTSSKRADKFSCDFCSKPSSNKLLLCSRCKKVAYCNKECQKAAWKAHKSVCKPVDKAPKSQPLTWDQLEAHKGAEVRGKTLEVRAVLDESMMGQVYTCKDRVGTLRRVAAYTKSRSIPGLKQGALLRWKNPRFHYFMDGSSGARIEEGDLSNITIS